MNVLIAIVPKSCIHNLDNILCLSVHTVVRAAEDASDDSGGSVLSLTSTQAAHASRGELRAPRPLTVPGTPALGWYQGPLRPARTGFLLLVKARRMRVVSQHLKHTRGDFVRQFLWAACVHLQQ